ncbi:hypothetical protein ACLB2K_013619 [Fragaria x ananassa]
MRPFADSLVCLSLVHFGGQRSIWPMAFHVYHQVGSPSPRAREGPFLESSQSKRECRSRASEYRSRQANAGEEQANAEVVQTKFKSKVPRRAVQQLRYNALLGAWVSRPIHSSHSAVTTRLLKGAALPRLGCRRSTAARIFSKSSKGGGQPPRDRPGSQGGA